MFSGVQALEDISLEVRKRKVHAVCGENNASKTTLISILADVFNPVFNNYINIY